MKEFDLEFYLVQAAPQGGPTDTIFTERVMQSISMSSVMRSTNKSSEQSLLFRLRHLPKFAVVILAIATLFTLSGVTYAIVETIKQVNQNVKIEKSGVNEQGRKQLSVAFDNCAEQKENGTTYELKKDSGLSAEDGAKVLQAKCERDIIAAWVKKDPTFSASYKTGGTDQTGGPQFGFVDLRLDGFVGTYKGISDASISIHSITAFGSTSSDQTLPLPANTRFIKDNAVVDQKTLDLKSGDTVLYFSPQRPGSRLQHDPDNVAIFKLSLEAKYYSLDMESFVRARQPCENNPSVTCLTSNSINMVYLGVTRGDAIMGINEGQYSKMIQGKVLSWNNTEFKVDAGGGAIYTFHTNKNIIDTYNQTTVYGLKSLDTIYANTDPNALKIGVGDTIEISYQEDNAKSARVLEWSQVYGINLMVERTTKDLSVLSKY